EPRCATALADCQRMRHRSGAAGADPELRRHADLGALHRQGDRRPPRQAESEAAEGGVVRFVTVPSVSCVGLTRASRLGTRSALLNEMAGTRPAMTRSAL